MEKQYKWKPRKEGYLEALNYIKGRMEKTITSLVTPWSSFNRAGVGGIEWNTTFILSGRPGSLKSTIKDNIIQQSFDLNKDQKFRVLDFSFEMTGKTTALREFSCAIARPYQYICSSDGNFNKKDLAACYEYAKKKANATDYPVDVVDEACTVNEFVDIVELYMGVHKVGEEYTKTIVSVDHSLLFVKAPFEGTEHEMLGNLGKALTKLKKKYPIIFLVLSQLNRNIEQPARSEDNKASNYLTTSDVYGSDSLLMNADMVVGLNRPALSNIRFYGANGYIIQDDKDLVVHWLKVRNGSTGISFFRCDFDSMTIREGETPPLRNSTVKKLIAPIMPEKPPKREEPTNLFQNESFLQQGNAEENLPF